MANHAAGALIERSETCTKVSGITCICWHFCKTARNLSKSLSPTRSAVSHH